jgi:chromatin segregation and condensation protein Rec8/ScpA/Scc1 (kleisin family)
MAKKKTADAGDAPPKEKKSKASKKVKETPVEAPAPVEEGPAPEIPNEAAEGEPIKEKKKKEPVVPEIKEIISVGDDLDDEIDEDAENEAELQKIKKWWLEEPWRSLLDPEMGKTVDFRKFDLSSLIEDFVQKMLKEELIDFRISGLAIYSSAVYYHKKIADVITEEEKIEVEKERERMRREVPKAISQPLGTSRKLATSDELFSAMRRAILETMQNREKLRIKREKREAKKTTKVMVKGRGKLPAEILKHITGSEETIEARLNRWHQKIKEIVRVESPKDETISIEYIKHMLYDNIESDFEKKAEYIRTFEALLFLMSLNKVMLSQRTMKSPISIKLIDKTKLDLK